MWNSHNRKYITYIPRASSTQRYFHTENIPDWNMFPLPLVIVTPLVFCYRQKQQQHEALADNLSEHDLCLHFPNSPSLSVPQLAGLSDVLLSGWVTLINEGSGKLAAVFGSSAHVCRTIENTVIFFLDHSVFNVTGRAHAMTEQVLEETQSDSTERSQAWLVEVKHSAQCQKSSMQLFA